MNAAVYDEANLILEAVWTERCGGYRSASCEACVAVGELQDAFAFRLLPGGPCQCGDYPDKGVRDRNHLTQTDCCDEPRFVCETVTVVDPDGTVNVVACTDGHGCTR